jgi:2-oxoglutarate ferredoxin oxidoreductase subunit beta
MAEVSGANFVARWTTAHPHQVVKTVMKGIRKTGTAFIEILSQCPVHRKVDPAEMLQAYKSMTVPLAKAKEKDEKRIVIGEFCDHNKPDWNVSYQEIIDQHLK